MKHCTYLFVALLCFFMIQTAAAVPTPEEATGILQEALPKDAGNLMEEIDLQKGSGFFEGMAKLFSFAAESGQSLLRDMLGHGARLLVIVLLCDGVRLLYCKEKESRVLQSVVITGALAIVLVSAGSIHDMIGLSVETIHIMNDFSKTLLPLLGAACAASGTVTASAVREVSTVLFSDVLITVITMLLVPLVHIYIGAITANAVLKEHSLRQIAKWIKKGMTWLLTILLTLFTAYLALSGAVSGSADAAALKVTKFAISGAVPVVGGIMSDAASTLLAGAAVLKNTIGVFGMFSVFALCLGPFLKIGIQYLLYKAVAFLADILDQSGLAALMGEIGGAFGMMLGMTGACAMLLIISIVVSISVVVPV